MEKLSKRLRRRLRGKSKDNVAESIRRSRQQAID
jgi:hypothetical protein